MVAVQYAYSRGRTFTRRISAAFVVLFGLFALLFTTTPKLWSSSSTNQDMFANFFTQNTAHADTPHPTDSVVNGDGYGVGVGAADCGTGTGTGDAGCSCA